MSESKPPWEKKPPKKNVSKMKLSPEQIEEAKARAKKAGRPYPNLVDNMAVSRKAKKGGEEKGDDFFPTKKDKDEAS